MKKGSGVPVKRDDGWMNIYTNQGIKGKDKQLGASFGAPLTFAETTLDDVYRGDGFTRRCIDLPTKEMVKNGFKVTGDTNGDITKYLAEKNLKAMLLQALQWARIQGGNLMVLGINDGGNLEVPLNDKNIKDIEFFKNYDRHRVSWTTADLYSDVNHRLYGTPQFYTVTPLVAGLGVSNFRVHESRVIVFDGMSVSERARVENDGWGDSYIQFMWTQLSNLAGAYFSAKNVIDDFIQTLLKVENLAQLLENGQEDMIKKRLEILDMGRHTINTMIVDAKEDYEKSASSIAGMADLLDRFAEALSAVTGIPVTLLMGRSPGGLNATGASDIQFWYDSIAQDQEAELLKPLTRICYLTQLAKLGPTKGKLIEGWRVVFNSLWKPTDKETAETRKITADTDKLYIESGVLDPEEVAMSRFGGSEYSIETAIDLENRRVSITEEEEPEEEEEVES